MWFGGWLQLPKRLLLISGVARLCIEPDEFFRRPVPLKVRHLYGDRQRCPLCRRQFGGLGGWALQFGYQSLKYGDDSCWGIQRKQFQLSNRGVDGVVLLVGQVAVQRQLTALVERAP